MAKGDSLGGISSAINPLTDSQLRATAVPVSVASLPLPSGGATETTLAALNTKVTAVNTGAVVVSSSALPAGAATEASTLVGAGAVVSLDGKTVVCITEAVIMEQSTTGANTSVAGTTTNSTTILASNASRRGATIFNDNTVASATLLYISLGSVCTPTNFTALINPLSYYEVPFEYAGIITGVFSAATGNVRLTEIT